MVLTLKLGLVEGEVLASLCVEGSDILQCDTLSLASMSLPQEYFLS